MTGLKTAERKWEAVDHECYPGMMTVKGPSSPITIITSATDIDFAGHLQRVNDAHLIAAAPELYEALIQAKKELEEIAAAEIGEEYNSPLINAALAKARGESQ